MAIGTVQPFAATGKTIAVGASTTSATAALAAQGESLLVTNGTAALAFVQLGAGPATVADIPILPNAQRVLQAGQFAKSVAVVLASGSGNVYFTPGTGAV